MSTHTPPALQRPETVPLMDRPVWTLRDASIATTISVRRLQQMISDGLLPCHRVGRRIILKPSEVLDAVFGGSQPSA